MEELSTTYMVAVANQLSFVSAFLGGVSATILVTIVVFISAKKSTGLMVASSALAACCLLTAVISAWRLVIALHPEMPVAMENANVLTLFRLMIAGYSIGFVSLIVSIGASGWLRSRRSGLITTLIASITLIIFLLTSSFL